MRWWLDTTLCSAGDQGAVEMAQMEHLINVYAAKAAPGSVADFMGYIEVSEERANTRLTPGLWLVRGALGLGSGSGVNGARFRTQAGQEPRCMAQVTTRYLRAAFLLPPISANGLELLSLSLTPLTTKPNTTPGSIADVEVRGSADTGPLSAAAGLRLCSGRCAGNPSSRRSPHRHEAGLGGPCGAVNVLQPYLLSSKLADAAGWCSNETPAFAAQADARGMHDDSPPAMKSVPGCRGGGNPNLDPAQTRNTAHELTRAKLI